MHTPAALTGKQVPRKRGGSLSKLRLWRSWREGIPNCRLPLDLPSGALEQRRVRMSLLSACGLRNRELAFGARRCSYSAQLRSSKGFGIQETLWNLTESNLSVPLGSARMDPFPLRGRLDASASPRCELSASAHEPRGERGCSLGLTFDVLRAARRQREPGAGRPCGVPACPED